MSGLVNVRASEPTGAKSLRRRGLKPVWTVRAENDEGITFEIHVREPHVETLLEVLRKGVLFLDSGRE